MYLEAGYNSEKVSACGTVRKESSCQVLHGAIMQTYQHLIMTQSIIVVRERTSSMLQIGYVDSKQSEK